MANNVIPKQKINAAAAGNSQLEETLNALATTVGLTQQVTNTSGKNLPRQAKAKVTFLQGAYTVEIQNPGTVSPVSSLQATQASQGATSLTNSAAVTPIYHQIRVATSPQFNIGSAVQTYGGTTGSTQTQFTITLASGKYYFQLRSSYDGVNFNQWRNANGGQAITADAQGVTLEQVDNALWGVFTLPGGQIVGVGSGLVNDQGSFGVPAQLYTSAMQAIPTPNGYVPQNDHLAHGMLAENITLVQPFDNSTPLTGPADYPTLVTMKYQDGEGNVWSGTCSILAMAYDPLGANVTEELTADGKWATFTLPGGGQIAVGSGVLADRAAMAMPTTVPWLSPSHYLALVSPNAGLDANTQAHGIGDSKFDTGTFTMNCSFRDGGIVRWGAAGNYFILAWTPGLKEVTTDGGKWLTFLLPGGGSVAFGGGVLAPFSSFALPDGFDYTKMLAVATPYDFQDTGHPMAGIEQCAITGQTTVSLQLTDTEGNRWTGQSTWMAFAWT